ncbi:6-carboxytetrahydropterin synthase [Idiomarina sp. HP20-50]|uniref:6-carboxytetrahydropterin synthase n=1 Tax=Idiomarina sp. HP20-50 TaxID=3070813 RepID=UPI00294B096E|nr:6-carboxytetrahydropterin synthase [Idiomarina sp. HP20-50]MDV6315147.1 6-carboxytetrahydropterin synthase [Idiomarina sp. HP20-50]
MQLFVNDLTVIDCSYLCPKRGIVGESWVVDIVLDGALNEQSMVLDFGRVKKQVKAIIDDSVDHKLLVPAEHQCTRVTHNSDDSANWVDFLRPNKHSIHLFCPADAFAFIDSNVVSVETVTDYLKAVIKRELPLNVEGLQLFLRPENIDGFYYHYTHGLKKHDGNCQRIAHGHRSKIQIRLDNIRQPVLEKEWSDKWQDIYLGTQEDVRSHSCLKLSKAAQDETSDSTHTCYSYTADQGLFELIVPNTENFVIEKDSTVECIADYLASEIKAENPGKKVEVRAFEGVGKGAIAYA